MNLNRPVLTLRPIEEIVSGLLVLLEELQVLEDSFLYGHRVIVPDRVLQNTAI